MTDFRYDLPGPHPDLVSAVRARLTDEEQQELILSCAAPMLPILDLYCRFRPLGLLDEGSTLTELGRAVAQEIIRHDPDATDPHEEGSR